jgi:hypothetical protein
MSRLFLLVALTASALLSAPAAPAQAGGTVDATVTMTPETTMVVDGEEGLIRLIESEGGERYVFELTLTQSYTTFEFRMQGFDVERPRQMVPSLVVPDTEFPLFHAYPNDRVWEADGPARVVNVTGSADAIVLRLGVDGPANRTLLIERDVAPPGFTLGEVTNLTHFSFYQETTTDEMALADLQVTRVGAAAHVENPTPDYHIRQRFPVQGLDPASEYDIRVVFTDWAGNSVASDPYRVTTAPRPPAPLPLVEPLSPTPNATVPEGGVVISARIQAVDSPLAENGIRLFYDKREITSDLRYEDEVLTFTPPTASRGLHSVAVEVTNEAGGLGVARWTFVVGDEGRSATPFPALLALAGLTLAAWCRRDD